MSKSSLSLSLSLGSRLGRLLVPLALAGTTALSAYAESPFLVPYHAAEKPIVDDQGRKQIIIDFVDSAADAFDDKVPPGLALKDDKRRGKVVNLIDDHSKKNAYEVHGMTTWVGASAVAFLTDKQISKLRNDKVVRLLTENSYSVTLASAATGMPWGNSMTGTETWSWGRNATIGKVRTSGDRRVYVIDTGVGWHADLPNVTRFNAVCGGGYDCNASNPVSYPLVGCWAHATHVAGIIGATANNGTSVTDPGGVAGVYAGVNIVSVAIRSAAGTQPCGSQQSNISEAELAGGLDFVYQHILYNDNWTYKPQIVNLSLNSSTLGFENGISQTNRDKLVKLATPQWYFGWAVSYFPGALVVQSAGNAYVNACSDVAGAFRSGPNATSTTVDGVMVVGAIHNDGRPVRNFNRDQAGDESFSDTYPPGLARDLASNFGPCVDVWAPGNGILSTWGTHASTEPYGATGRYGWYSTVTSQATPYSGNPPSVGPGSNGWLFMSGTSMAAPHVAGAAAYVADRFSLSTPQAIEAKLRELFRTTGFTDDTGNPISIIQLTE